MDPAEVQKVDKNTLIVTNEIIELSQEKDRLIKKLLKIYHTGAELERSIG